MEWLIIFLKQSIVTLYMFENWTYVELRFNKFVEKNSKIRKRFDNNPGVIETRPLFCCYFFHGPGW